MKKGFGGWCIIGFFGLMIAANAQTPSPPSATRQFDGTYRFVSATKLNETYMTTWRTRMGQCGDIRRMGPLTIANGQARYSGFGRVTKEGFEGTVGPQGELAMRLAAPASQSSLGVELITRGTVDGNGIVRARQMGRGCSYDLVWQKETDHIERK
ncbi:MAG: hypothetical protein JOZ11_08490 [Alphaproteobacteria bacterium]|nr:hypothetical protein [Alphaproteobacteria bacterium]